MNSDYRPDGDYGSYDFYQRGIIKDARRAFSRFMLALFIFTVAAYVVIFAVEIALAIMIGEEATLKLYDNVFYQWLMGVGPMYLVSFPILYLIVRSMPKRELTKKKMGAPEFLGLMAVAQFLMLVGSLIGNFISASISVIVGYDVSNQTSDLIESSPSWLVILIVVFIGPVVEELIFRKLMIDRLSRYGSILAIVTSAVAFALFHGNFFQFFYAAFLGVLLGYVYVKTGNWLYSLLMHVLINFIGSVVTEPVIKAMDKLQQMSLAMLEGTAPDLKEFTLAMSITTAYTVFQYGTAIVGAVLLGKAIKRRNIGIRNDKLVNLPNNSIAKVTLGNAGSILFLVASFIIFILSIISSAPAAV